MSNKVNVDSFVIRTYNGTRTPVWCAALPTKSFTDLDGNFVGGGSIKTVDKDWIVKVAVTDNGDGTFTTEPFTGDTALSATRWNGVDQPVKWNFYLLDSRLNVLKPLYSNIVIANTLTTTTIQDAELLSRSPNIPRTTSYVSHDEFNLQLAGLDLAPDATTLVKGKTRLSTAPADSSDPVSVGDNDLRLVDNLVNYGGDLDTAISEIGSAKRVLVVNAEVSRPTTNIPSNITIKFGSRGKFTAEADAEITVNSMEDAGNRQVFDVSASNAKVLFGRNAVEKINVAWYCGTTNGTDATKAINQALESCENNDGGTIFFPEARYTSSGGHIVPKATTLEGSGNFITVGYGGTNIKLSSPTDTYLFKIGDTTYDTAFTNLALDGTGTTSKDGILMEGTAPNSSGGCVIEKVVFYGFENGINYNTLSVGTTWQMAQVAVRDSKFLACAVGIRQTSVNSSWAIDNTNFYIPEDGWGLVLENGGICGFRNCEFAGNSNPNAGGIQVNGAHVALNFHGCQEEGTACFLENNASDISGIFNFYGCLIQSKIQLNASCVINSHGSNYLSKVFKFGGIGTVCHITSIGDHVQERDVADGVTVVSPPVLTEGGTNNVHIVSEENAILESFAKRLPMRFVSPVTAVGNPTTPVLTLGHYTGGADEDKVLLRLGRLDADEVPDFYYDIYRDYMTGLLNFRGNQDLAYRGYKFDAAVFGLDEAYNAVDWNGNFSFPTKNAIRDKIEALVLASGLSAASTTEALTGTDTTKGVTPDALAALWEKGSDIASAGTVSVGEGGYFNITGTTGITDIDFATDKAGRKVWLKFAGALTLTHSSTLILPTGANITTAAGDTACFISEGSDMVRCVVYQTASGASLSGGGGGIGGSTGATDNAVPRADGAGGATLQSSGVTITDSNNINTSNADGKFLFGSSDPDASTSGSPNASGIYSRDTHNNLDLVAFSGTIAARVRIAAGAQYVEVYPNGSTVGLQVDTGSSANDTALLILGDGTLKRVKMEAAAGGKRTLYVDA